MPLQIAPSFLLPTMALNWASKAKVRNFIDMPFDGFLAPPSRIAVLTRILRHSELKTIIAYKNPYFNTIKKLFIPIN